MVNNTGAWPIEELIDFAQDRDNQIDRPEQYWDVAEELAYRVSNLLACVRMQDNRSAVYQHGHMLYTDEIKEALADHVV